MTAAFFRTFLATAFALFAPGAAADPYLALRNAYAQRDAAAAAAAYAPNAVYREQYDGSKPVLRSGRQAIEEGFEALFAQFEPPEESVPLDLNFRFEARADGADGSDKGVYRLSVRAGAQTQSYYGRFAVTRRGGLFVDDASSDATRADFERLPGPVAYDAHIETLDPLFYDRLRGRYRDSVGCDVVITRSMGRRSGDRRRRRPRVRSPHRRGRNGDDGRGAEPVQHRCAHALRRVRYARTPDCARPAEGLLRRQTRPARSGASRRGVPESADRSAAFRLALPVGRPLSAGGRVV